MEKVEYLVVVFDECQQKVRLSLRQADILQSLAQDEELLAKGGCVPGIQHVEGLDAKHLSSHSLTLSEEISYRYSILNLVGSCWSQPQEHHGG